MAISSIERVDINDVSKYKKCQKKKYNVWVCMPPKGTCVINKLEQREVMSRFKGRTYITASEMMQMKIKRPDAYAYLAKNAYIIDDKNRYVISGTRGELWVVPEDKLMSTYIFDTGEAIRVESINKRKVKGTDYMDWQLVETNVAKGSATYAMCVPTAQEFQIMTGWKQILKGNDKGIDHGMGDMVLCGSNPDGTPNLADRWIVNGRVFIDTYDNRGWQKYVMPDQKSDVLGSLPKPEYTLMDPKAKAMAEKLAKFESEQAKVKSAAALAPSKPEEVANASKKEQPKRSSNILEKLAGIDKKETKPVAKEVAKPVEKPVKPVEKVDAPVQEEKKSRKVMYTIQGKYTDGTRTLGWHLTSSDGSKTGRYSKDQVAFLAGKGQIENCIGLGIRSYETTEDGVKQATGVYFKGKDCDLSEITVYDMSGKFRNTESVGHIRKDDTAESVMNKVLLIGVCKKGKKVVTGYIAKNSAGKTKFIPRAEVIERAKAGQIGNARVNFYNGKYLLRSIAGETPLDSLPLMNEDGTVRTE